ncbi:hypothetical protein K0M31_000785 [Melipona bicolor]|uniref:Uncharacterized protein n=1 Tax=Melipona bicolor TaxID=60889 RepID=A0AA40KX57_9HYME|nr:hypothetical protein K0M31_000785 [Melipona bicolor]
MDTSSRTKSVERPVRAVDLFIASLDALTLLGGSSTLSARIDSDERATLLWLHSSVFVCGRIVRERERERESRKGREPLSIERVPEKENGPVLRLPKAVREEEEEEEEEGTERNDARGGGGGGEPAEEERSPGPPANSSNISHRLERDPRG